jgi:hypothetical protein
MIRSFSRLAALTIAGLLAYATSKAAPIGTATISQTPLGGGEFQYNLSLTDTGATPIGTFWFGWVPGDNFMPVTPTAVTFPIGWQDTITSGGPSGGFAIQWTAVAPAGALAPGNTLTGFSFDSTLTLAQLQAPSVGNAADPVNTAFLYSGAPFSDAGFQLTPTVATPEPTSFLLSGVGLGVMLAGFRRRILQPMGLI